MFKTIKKASENFCIHQLRLPYEICDKISNEKSLIVYMDIDAQDSNKYRVYFASEPDLMQKVATIFLDEKNSNEESLINMTLETINLIVGSAKVIAQEDEVENSYNINTPFFEKNGQFDFDFDDSIVFKIQNKEMLIAIKELND